MHRPTEAFHGIHATLVFEGFGEFVDNMKSNSHLGRRDYEFTYRFSRSMSVSFAQEKNRQKEVLNLLREYFGVDMDPRIVSVGSISATDGSIVAPLQSDSVCSFLALICAVKNEMGEGGCSPIEQNVGYYLNVLKEAPKELSNESSCPIILMTIVGPYLSISFAAHLESIIVDPIVPFLPFLVLPHDKEMMQTLARVLWSTKKLIERLLKYYKSVPLSTEFNPQRIYPYPKSFPFVESTNISQDAFASQQCCNGYTNHKYRQQS